jgi:cytoskeletal protein CcmA (bactofilin family)
LPPADTGKPLATLSRNEERVDIGREHIGYINVHASVSSFTRGLNMALWKEPAAATPTPPPAPKAPPMREPEGQAGSVTQMSPELARRVGAVPNRELRESVISADLTIEGKIEGAGHVRIAGSFKGDVHVQGNLTIEAGARITGQVRANVVVVGGELQGNIEGASRVELLETGIIAGDVKAGSLAVAAGSRMRGQVEFGWEDKASKPFSSKVDGRTS